MNPDDDTNSPLDDDPGRPRRRRAATGSNGMATAALILGLLSPFCSVFTAIPAIICGAMGISRAGKVGSGQGMAITGLIFGILGITLCPVFQIGLLLPAVQKVREAAARQMDQRNYKMAAMGAHNFESTHGHLPGPYHFENGKTYPGLSWRVSVAMYAEQPTAFPFDLTQPWDGPANLAFASQPVKLYVSPSDPAGTTDTRMQVFVGPKTIFDPNGGPPRITSISDGTSNTILYAESATLVPWSAPRDMTFDPNGPLPALGHTFRKGFLVCMADGSVKFVRNTIAPETLKAAITARGGEVTMGLE